MWVSMWLAGSLWAPASQSAAFFLILPSRPPWITHLTHHCRRVSGMQQHC